MKVYKPNTAFVIYNIKIPFFINKFNQHMIKKIIPVLLLILSANQVRSQNSFYNTGVIQTISIHFPFSNWDYRLDTAKAGSEGYVLSDTVTVNGVVFLNCGVKYKGNSSYSANRTKNPLHIKLDYITPQNYQGVEDIKLGNGFSDPSMIREVSSYEILRQYMDAPLCNFAKVYVNGNYYGIMSNSEDIGNSFLTSHYFSSKYEFVKCNPDNAGPGSSGSNLIYYGTNIASYSSLYELKSDTGWYELIHLCDTLNNYSSAINTILDIDRTLWMLAFNNVLVNLDSYSGSFRQNYYLYRDHKNCWIPTVWDLNMSYGGFPLSGVGGSLNLAGMQNMNPLLHETDVAWPLISKLLANPVYKRMYTAHMRTINNENFLNALYKNSITTFRGLIDNAVQTDANFLFTYSQFQTALTTTIGSGPFTTPGVYQLMDTRASYLNTVSPLNLTPPSISNVTTLNIAPAFGSNVGITATVTNTNSNAVYLGYRNQKQDRFERILMFDDGVHNDGAAGDNIYGVDIPANSLQIQYYIYAENNNAGMFSPERAEHEFYTIYPVINQASANDLVLNEVLPNNVMGITNENGKTKDWIEVYNKTNTALGLHNMYLSDDISNLKKWNFDSLTFIPANGHLLIWADDLDHTILEAHTNFNLSETGDSLFLGDVNNLIADSISFVLAQADTAFARCPDGTGQFQLTVVTTPRTVNFCSMSGENALDVDASILLYPNPAADLIYYEMENFEKLNRILVTDVAGRVVLNFKPDLSHSINVSELHSGLYFISMNFNDQKQHIFKVVIN